MIVKELAKNIIKCVGGILLGSLLSCASPACFIPFLFAPQEDLFTDSVDDTKKHKIHKHFTKTFVINLKREIFKMDATTDHLEEIGAQNRQRLEAVNGYTLSDKDFHQILSRNDITFESIHRRMAGANDRRKRAVTGCYLSHLAVLKTALREDLSGILILEDDAVFPQTKKGVEIFDAAMKE